MGKKLNRRGMKDQINMQPLYHSERKWTIQNLQTQVMSAL